MKKVTATQIANELGVSRSYLYYLKKTAAVQMETKNGKVCWNETTKRNIENYIKNKEVEKTDKRNKNDKVIIKNYKEVKINNRRYLGNKYKLLPYIRGIIDKECPDVNTIADIFAGTGVVAAAFNDKNVITNDLMYSNYLSHVAFFDNEDYDREKIINIIDYYNKLNINDDNYMTNNFTDTFFDRKACSKIGYIRENIEIKHKEKEINQRERAILITSLLYAMDKIANTCGHYDAYRRNGTYDKTIELCVPHIVENSKNNLCYNQDANVLVKNIKADLVYIDPPYNSRQYCDAYHVLENVAKWEKPQVYGVAKKMDRSHIKSKYCTTKATETFEELIANINTKYIVLSYNNMATKGDDRSNAKISDKDILAILSKKGKVKVFSEKYKAFSTGKSEYLENEERIFICKCKQEKKEVLLSPLNYTGGKGRLLKQLMPHFPTDCSKVIDMFAGGCNVGINLNSSQVIFNDINEKVIDLFNIFKKNKYENIREEIKHCINKYGLSDTSKYGYEYYNCDSGKGLADYNKEGFLSLRNDFNQKSKDLGLQYYIMLYVLIVYSFNNQIRFNSKGEFNLPVGKRDFNIKMQDKLEKFINELHSGRYSFICGDFKDIEIENNPKDTFFYADPPYLITCATYNEQGGWNEEKEESLLNYLDEIHEKGYKFALSNVIRNKGKVNKILENWCFENKDRYRVISLDYNYKNCNYQVKDKRSETQEVIIVNY